MEGGTLSSEEPTASATLTSNLVEGQYPPYEDVIPKDPDKKMTCGTADFLSAVKRASLLVTEVHAETVPVSLPGMELLQNYPNPVRRTGDGSWTAFLYRLDRSGPVGISIRDLLGRTAAVILEAQVESGWHSIRYDTSPLRNGIYFYRLEGNGSSLTRRMLLLH